MRHACKADYIKLQPTPAQAMALFASGLLHADDFPDIAARWLGNGMDSENLRILAGADNEDPDDIRDLWKATLQDLKISTVTTAEGATPTAPKNPSVDNPDCPQPWSAPPHLGCQQPIPRPRQIPSGKSSPSGQAGH